MPADLTAHAALTHRWRDLRDDCSAPAAATVEACIRFAWSVGLLTDEQHELWLRRITTCPGHDDEGGRDWCAYCGKMPKEKDPDAR